MQPIHAYTPVLLEDLAATQSREPEVPKYLYDDHGLEISYVVEWERAPK